MNSIYICIAVVFLSLMSGMTAFTAENTVVNAESGAAYNEGLALFNRGDYTGAIVRFEAAFRLDDRNIAALFAHGLSLNKLKNYPEAADIIASVLAADSTHVKARTLYPVLLEQAGMLDEALTEYDRSIRQLPDNYSLYHGKARIYLRMEKFGDAIPILSRAIEIQPRDTNVLYMRAQCYTELGRFEEAYQDAVHVLELNDGHARARIIIADYKRLSGNFEAALADYAVALKSIETKAYAEYYIDSINQQLEEMEIEREYEDRQKMDSQD